jgi:molecular chaperone GrpE
LTEDKNQILREIQKLNLLFESKIAYDDQKDRIIDKLHDELQIYKEDLYNKLIKPILLDIIQIKSSIERTEQFYKENTLEDRTRFLEIISSLSLELGDMLEKYEIRIFKSKSEKYISQKQRVVRTIDTDVKELDKKIARSYSYCYEMDGKVISPERVDVFLYKDNL